MNESSYKGFTIRRAHDQLGTVFQVIENEKVIMWDYNIVYVKAFIDWKIDQGGTNVQNS